VFLNLLETCLNLLKEEESDIFSIMEKMKLLAIIFLFVIQQCNLFVEANNHHQKNQMVSQLKREVQRLREKDEALEKEVQKVREKDEVLEELIFQTQLSFSEEVIHLRKEVEEELVNKAKFLTNPCQHGKPFYENHFKCQCDQGWTGDKCQVPEGAKKIYQGQGWKYFKVPISKGPFNITGKVLSTRCREVGMETPCSCAKRHLAQKACVETAHTSGSKTSNMIHLQSAIGDKGYNSYDEDHMAQTFSYSLDHRENKNDYPTKEDGACGYNINDCQCTGVAGQKTVSNGQYFALCALKI